MGWHTDSTYMPIQAKGAVFTAHTVPSTGGETGWADTQAAYEALSDGMKDLLDGLVAVHDNRIQAPSIAAERNAKFTSKVRDNPDEEDEPEMEHPVVRTHPDTGRKALFVCRPRTHRFKGMTEAESKPLLEYLFEHSHRPEFTCRFRWEKGSIAFWDNRCVMHKALNDYPGHKRYMNRVTVNGTRPV